MNHSDTFALMLHNAQQVGWLRGGVKGAITLLEEGDVPGALASLRMTLRKHLAEEGKRATEIAA